MSRPTLLLLPLLLVLFGLTATAWWLPNRPRAGDIAMADTRFNSVSFAPFRAGQSPLTGRFPSAAEVEADLALIAPSVRAIRSYAAIEGDYDVAALAQRHGLKLWQGVWLGADRAQNAREIARAIEQAHRYPDTVERVVVGNEVLLRRDLPVAELTAAIDAVRAAVRQPVTYADVWEFWRQFPQVASHVDIVTIHLLPYWEDTPTGIDRAVEHVGAAFREIAALFPGKTIAIGETGWPSRGRPREDAAPGVVNQAVFLRRFIALSHAEGFDYNLIEAFDQVWKYQSEGTVGANWGLWTAARLPKFPLDGPVVENPRWRTDAAAGCVLGLMLLGFGLLAGRRLPVRRQLALAVLAMALGDALAYAALQTSPDLYDAYLAVAAIGNLIGQAALAMLLVARFVADGPRPAARTGADATRAVRDLLLLRGRAVLRSGTVLRGGAKLRGGAWEAGDAFHRGRLDDLSFVFAWTAMALELMLLFDPRYRDFPFAAFAVPLVSVSARFLMGDLPRGGGGREEAAAGAVLALAAIASAARETPLNGQAMAWSACALLLAAPLLRRCRPARGWNPRVVRPRLGAGPGDGPGA